MDVVTLRGYVREHLDVDDEELPDTLLNIYLQDAFDVTMSSTNQWPRNEKVWSVTKADGSTGANIPDDVNIPSIMSVLASDGHPLIQIDANAAEQMFVNPESTGTLTAYYSIWDRQLKFWPGVGSSGEYTVTLRGYRQPTWDNAASAIPDLDPRLHIALAYYAMSLAYGQQEDEVLEAVWLTRWERTVAQHAKVILEPARGRPIVLHGGVPSVPYTNFVVNMPS